MAETSAERAEQRIEDRLSELEAAVFGIRNQGGVVSQLRGLRDDFHNWRMEDSKRRETQARVLLAAMGTALVAVVGTVIQLLVTISQAGHP